MDVKNVFLQGELEEHVYMVQPSGFLSELSTLAVCLLKKSMYELKQAPRAWNAKIMQRLHKMEFALSKSDSLLVIWQGRTKPVSILLYIDDLVIVDADLEEISRVKSMLTTSFVMKDLGNFTMS